MLNSSGGSDGCGTLGARGGGGGGGGGDGSFSGSGSAVNALIRHILLGKKYLVQFPQVWVRQQRERLGRVACLLELLAERWYQKG